MQCPCDSSRSFDECCGPFLSGEAQPPTAEALMRSRYSAFARGQVDYILDTHAESTRHEIDRKETEDWSKNSEWRGLRIRATTDGGESHDSGTVEFVATYERQGQELIHHELAEFRRENGRWFFVDGETPKPVTTLRTEPKVGRNDPCPCGSGKKYKKCCGTAA